MIGERSFDLSKTIRQMQTISQPMYKKPAFFSASNVVWFIGFLLWPMWLYTALAKFLNPEKFYGTIHDVPMVRPFASFLTSAVPVTEFIICILLLMGTKVRISKIPASKIGHIASGGLMLAFTIYISLMLVMYGSKLPCSCGGFISQLSWQAHILFNLFCAGLSMWALLLMKRLNKR